MCYYSLGTGKRYHIDQDLFTSYFHPVPVAPPPQHKFFKHLFSFPYVINQNESLVCTGTWWGAVWRSGWSS